MQDAMSIEREAVERWNAHDREGYLALFDEKVTFTDAAMGYDLIGREELGKGFFDVYAEAYPDNQIKQIQCFTDGTWICFEGRLTGTHTGIFHGHDDIEMPPTGKSIDTPYIWLAEVRDGKITSARIYYDRLVTLEQEGIVGLKEFAAQLTPA